MVAPEREALARLGRRLGDVSVLAVIESVTGASIMHRTASIWARAQPRSWG